MTILIIIGELAKIILLKKQKYFTPIRIIGMLVFFIGIALRKISNSDIQFTLIGGLLIFGFVIYVAGWNRKRVINATGNIKK